MRFALKLITLLFVITLLSISFVSFFIYDYNKKFFESHLVYDLKKHASHSMEMLDRKIEGTAEDLMFLAGDPVITSDAYDPEQKLNRLNEYKNTHSDIFCLYLLDKDRKKVTDTTGSGIGLTHKETSYWRDVIGGNPSYGRDVYFSSRSGGFSSHFAVPVYNENKEFSGTVVAELSMNLLYGILEGAHSLTAGTVMGGHKHKIAIDLVDKEGTLLYSNFNSGDILKKNYKDTAFYKHISERSDTSAFVSESIDGDEEDIYIYVKQRGYNAFSGNGWTLFFHMPVKEALMPAKGVRRNVINAMVIVGIFTILLVGIVVTILLRPLIQLRDAISEVGRGDFNVSIPACGKDEIGDLAESFRRMLNDLRKTLVSRDSLIKEVEERQRVQIALRASEEKYRSLIENTSDVVWSADIDGIITFVSSQVKKYGYTVEEVVGRSIFEFVYEEDKESVSRDIKDAFETGRDFPMECRLLKKDGKPVDVEQLGSFVLKDNKLVAMVGVIRDISSRKDIKARHNLKLSLFNVFNIPGLSLKECCDKVIEDIAEYSDCDAVGIRLKEGNKYPYFASKGYPQNFAAAEDCPCMKGNINDQSSDRCICSTVISGAFNRELSCFVAGGSFWTNDSTDKIRAQQLLSAGISVKDSCGIYFCRSLAVVPIVAFNDTIGLLHVCYHKPDSFSTDRIWFYEEIGRLLGALFARRQTEDDLVKARITAEAANKAKSDFLAVMSHEIRTPMNAILGFSSLLQKTHIEPDQIEYIKMLNSSATQLLALIDDILDISKIESGSIELLNESFDLEETVTDAVKMIFTKEFQKKNITVGCFYDPALPKVFVGDKGRIRQILLNLLNNAVKFTAAGRIDVEVMETDGVTEKERSVLIKVSDTGKGIPQDKHQTVFNIFSQVDSSTARHYGGAGLGLAITKRIVEIMGGEIKLASEVNKGSIFTVRLPLSEENSAAVPRQNNVAEGEHTLSGIRILVVEDSAVNIKLIQLLLEKHDADVDVAELPAEALKKIKEKEYDIILMDVQMPDIDGLELTRIFRSEYGIKCPIIAVTAHAFLEDKEKCLRAGMNDYITKPVNIDILLQKIMMYLK